MKMRFLVAALLLISTFSAGAHAQPAAKAPTDHRSFVVDRVVAIVNDTIILESELRARLASMVPDLQNIQDPKERARRLDKLKTQMLDEMVNEELIVQAAAEARIDVDASEVQAALDEIKKQNKLDDAGLAAALSEQGYTLAAYREDLRRQLLRLRAINQLVRPKVNITDEDVKAKYDEMSRRSNAVSAVQLAHILIKVPDKASEQDLSAAKDKAATAIQRVKAGEAFDKVAAEMSDDDATKTTGGQLGWFERGSMAPEWEVVVFAMDKGDVRGPVSGPQGLEVFYVTDIKRNDLQKFDDLKEKIRADLQRREMDKQTQQWVDELKKKAYIDIKM
ncbi:MAG TPA: peptidylprolyl isomerase [Kofleriaceae bacterium]|nr:peptidylprolyl isomerase [Kofleriaceae bacterium]